MSSSLTLVSVGLFFCICSCLSLSCLYPFLNLLSQRHHQHCWALGSGGSILELSGVDIGAVSDVFSQKPPLQSPVTKTLSHKHNTAHEREMFWDHQKRDGDNRWIAMKHQGLSLQNSSLAGNDRQASRGETVSDISNHATPKRTDWLLSGCLVLSLVEALQNFFLKGFYCF